MVGMVYWVVMVTSTLCMIDSGQVLQIDTARTNHTWIGDAIYSGGGVGWGDAFVGVDKCIYWPPFNANRVLKFDPRHYNCHRSWGMTWVKDVTNGSVEL
jgi:hypothetical protein